MIRRRAAVLTMVCAAALGVMVRAAEIHDAAVRGDIERVRTLITTDPAQIASRGRGGMLPIHFAALGGHDAIVALLLDRGAEPDSRSLPQMTPLHVAAMFNRRPVVELLLARGAELEARAAREDTPLMTAAEAGHADMVRLLLGRGADPLRRDTAGASAFDRMCASGMWDLVKQQVMASGERLKGAPLATALHAAAAAGNKTLADELLALGADRHTRSASGDTLLISAARGGLADLTRALLGQGEDPKAVNKDGRTALHYAALANAPGLVDLLVSKGAGAAVRGTDGRTALDIADDNGFTALASTLRKLGGGRTPRPVHRLGDASGKTRAGIGITYIGNDGFLIESGRTRVMIDAPQTQMVGISAARFGRMLGQQAPFESVPVLLYTHAHTDHFDAGMAGTFLQRHHETRVAGNALVIDGLAAADKTVYAAVRDRVVLVEPEWGKPVVQRVNDVEITVLLLAHDNSERPLKNCAFLFAVGGIKLLHLGDMMADVNLDAFRAFGLEKTSIDIVFGDPGLLASAAGRTIVTEHIKPRAIILMHMRTADVDMYLRQYGPTTPNLYAFREPMEKQLFAK